MFFSIHLYRKTLNVSGKLLPKRCNRGKILIKFLFSKAYEKRIHNAYAKYLSD